MNVKFKAPHEIKTRRINRILKIGGSITLIRILFLSDLIAAPPNLIVNLKFI